MFTWLLYFVLILMAVCAFFVVFNLLGLFICNKLKDKAAKAGGEAAKRYVSHMNPLFKLLMKSKKIQEGTDAAAEKQVNKQCKRANRIFICGTALSLALLVVLGVLAETLYEMNLSVTSTTSVISILTRNKDCTCYVKCTNDADDDHKSTYELLFGPTEFATFAGHMKLNPQEQDEWKALYPDVKDGETRDYDKLDGKKQNEFIAEHLNDKMVDDYKTILQEYQNFMKSADGKDRMKMSNDELMADLKKMCKDYKVNGRNPNCKVCKSANTSSLRRKCNGMNKWVKGWTWQEIADANGNNTNNKNNGSVEVPALGHASGKYAVTLKDGNSYYWYHQSSEACKYNVIKYGQRYSNVNLGGRGSAASRGCSSYATAMAISNVLGEEVTPFDVQEKLEGVKPSKSSNGTITYYGRSPIDFCSPIGVTFNGVGKKAMVKKAVDVYGNDGLQAAYLGHSQKEFDKYLDKGALIVVSIINAGGSYDSMPWYRGGGHYIVIRKKENNKYYHLNSCVIGSLSSHYSGNGTDEKAKSLMNIGISWNTLSSHFKAEGAVAFWSDNKVLIDGDDSTGTNTFSNYEYNKDVLKAVIKAIREMGFHDFNSSKSDRGGSTYRRSRYATVLFTELSSKYGAAAVCGMLGNMMCEASPGQVAHNMDVTIKNWDGKGKGELLNSAGHAGLVVRNKANVKASLNTIHYINKYFPSVGACDTLYVGAFCSGLHFKQTPGAGWGLLEAYEKQCTNYSDDELVLAEASYTINKNKGVLDELASAKKNKYNAVTAAFYFNKHYEKQSQAIPKRQKNAEIFYKYLKDLKVSPTIGNGSSNKKVKNKDKGKTTITGNGWETTYTDLGHKVYKQKSGDGTYDAKGAIKNILKYTKDTDSSKIGSEVVIYGTRFIGNRYVWGGTSLTNGCDCSGFIMSLYAHFGVSLPHSSGGMRNVRNVGVNVAENDIQPGDIVCYHNHVALYIGGGKILHASSADSGIKIGNKYNYRTILAIRRPTGVKSRGNLYKK